MGNKRTTGPDYLDQKKKKKEPTSMQKRLAAESRKKRRGAGPAHGIDLTKNPPYPKTISEALGLKKKLKKK